MNFKIFFENQKDIEKTLRGLPPEHIKLLNGLKINYTCKNTLDFSNKHVGILKNNKITVSAPWNYSRQFTTLHEIGHIIWCRILNEKQRKEWEKILKREKNKMQDHPSLNQNCEEIFAMCYANHYSQHKLLTFYNKTLNNFIANL